MISIGDKVKIIKSPYWSVKVKGIFKILDIQFSQFPKMWRNYILDNPEKCHTFKIHEIEKIEEN